MTMKNKVNNSKCITAEQPVGEGNCHSVSISADEYGNPIIQGTYTGQTFPNMDALLPGRQTNTEESAEEPAADKTEEPETAPNKSKKLRQTAAALVAIISSWFLVACLWYRGSVECNQSTAAAEERCQLFNLPPQDQSGDSAIGGNVGSAGAAGSARTAVADSNDRKKNSRSSQSSASAGIVSPAPMSEQQALYAVSALVSKEGDTTPKSYLSPLKAVSSRDGATMLLNEADQLAQKGKTELAEVLYRRALSIFAMSCGPLSPEYHQTLLRLSGLFHSTKRIADEQEINNFMRRQSQSMFYSQALQ